MSEEKNTPKVVRSESEESEEDTPNINHHEAIQLYERGLISAKTVLEAYGFDANQEIEKRKGDAVQVPPSSHQGYRQESPFTIQQARIEQARRNFEALSKSRDYDGKLTKAVTASVEKNIKIMNEVADLK